MLLKPFFNLKTPLLYPNVQNRTKKGSWQNKLDLERTDCLTKVSCKGIYIKLFKQLPAHSYGHLKQKYSSGQYESDLPIVSLATSVLNIFEQDLDMRKAPTQFFRIEQGRETNLSKETQLISLSLLLMLLYINIYI